MAVEAGSVVKELQTILSGRGWEDAQHKMNRDEGPNTVPKAIIYARKKLKTRISRNTGMSVVGTAGGALGGAAGALGGAIGGGAAGTATGAPAGPPGMLGGATYGTVAGGALGAAAGAKIGSKMFKSLGYAGRAGKALMKGKSRGVNRFVAASTLFRAATRDADSDEGRSAKAAINALLGGNRLGGHAQGLIEQYNTAVRANGGALDGEHYAEACNQLKDAMKSTN